MVKEQGHKELSQESWNCTRSILAKELASFVDEFGSFTPPWFAEVKFHLLKHAGLSQESNNEICTVAIENKLCGKCDQLYVTKKCLLWYKLFDLVTWKLVRRAPPCIRNAFKEHQIRTVTDYLTKVNLVSPLFYKAKLPPRCKRMNEWGLCEPDRHCKNMQNDRLSSYRIAREQDKQR